MSKTPDPSLGVHRVVSTRAGWRLFRCDECSEQWQTTSRDIYSPSGEDCVCCGAWVHPFSRSQDPPVATDDKGNVIEHECIVVFHGNPQRCRKCETTQADLVAGVCKNCLDRCFTDTNIETDLDYGLWSTEMETVRSFGRVDDEKWKKIKLAAYDSGKSFSTWALDILLNEAEKVEAKKAKKKTSKVS